MHMHSGTIVADDGFRHESRRFSVRVRDIVHDIFEYLGPVGALHQAAVLGTYFTLSGSCDFMMMYLDFDTQFFQCKTHGGTNIVQGINRRNGKISPFYTGAVPGIAPLVFYCRAPGCFLGFDLYRAARHIGMPDNGVKDEEFRFRAEIGDVSV